MPPEHLQAAGGSERLSRVLRFKKGLVGAPPEGGLGSPEGSVGDAPKMVRTPREPKRIWRATPPPEFSGGPGKPTEFVSNHFGPPRFSKCLGPRGRASENSLLGRRCLQRVSRATTVKTSQGLTVGKGFDKASPELAMYSEAHVAARCDYTIDAWHLR